MRKEVYRIDIPIEAQDEYSSEIRKAKSDVNELEKNVDRSTKKSTQHMSRYEQAVNRTTQRINRRMDKLTRGRWSMTLRAVDRASRVIRNVSSFAQRVTRRTYRITLRAIDMATRPIRNMVSSISSILGTVGIVGGAAGGIVIPLNLVAERQDMESSFEVLLGSADKAKKRVQELTDFAQTGIFMRDDVFEASRILEVFTDGAISTGKNLRQVGDIAAGTQQPIEDVALWMGRMYDSMEAGRPIGESTARLQEMGAISGKARARLEELAESGGDIRRIWPEVTREFARFDGMMEKLSGNLKNQFSYVWAFFQEDILRPWGEGLADSIQPYLKRFTLWQAENRDIIEAWKDDLRGLAESFSGNILDGVYASVNYVSTNYLENEEFQDLSFGAKVRFVIDDTRDAFSEWWEDRGREQVTGLSNRLGTAFGETINGAILGMLGAESEGGSSFVSAGFEAGSSFVSGFIDGFDAGEVAKNITKKLVEINVEGIGGAARGEGFGGLAGAAAVDLLALGAISRLLRPLKMLKGPAKWIGGLFGGGRRGPAPTPPRTPLPKGDTRMSRRESGSWLSRIKVPKGLGKLTRRLPYIGAAVNALSLLGADKEDMPGAIGGIGGGVSGALAGAALGSVIPGVGTVIGGIAGGLGGSLGGEALGGWLGENWDSIKKGASETGQWISDSFMAGIDAIKEEWNLLTEMTSNTGEWFGDGWNTIKEKASNTAESIGNAFGAARDKISETIFSGDWWGEKWDSVKGWTSNKWGETTELWYEARDAISNTLFSGDWWAENIGFVYGYLESTLFSSEWWSGKWENVTTWASEKLEPLAEIFSTMQEKIGETLFNSEWWRGKWDAVQEWTVEKLEPIAGVFVLAQEKISETIFNSEWWSGKWQGVKEWTAEEWEGFTEVWNTGIEAISTTVFNGEWWGEKWENVKGWTSEKWEGFTDVWNAGVEAIGSTVFNSEWWLNNWESVKGWTSEKWATFSEVWETAKSKISETLFSQDWWSGKWDAVKGWASDAWEGIKEMAGGLGESFNIGRQRGQGAAEYANGGIINRPHLGLVGEAGPEAIIPLSSNRRSRALDLYERTGRALGVMPYASGGMVSGSVQTPAAQSVNANISIGGVTAQSMSEEAMNYGRAFSETVAEGINNKVVSLDAWKQRNIETPMQTVVQEAVAFGSNTVTSFTSGQNSTPTHTKAYLDRQVKHPFEVIQGGASQWGSGTIDEFTTGMRSREAQVKEASKYLAEQVEKAFREQLGIASPSKVMYRHGVWTGVGVVKGLSSVDIKSFAEEQAGSLAAAFSGMGAVGGNVSQWLQAAMMITGVPGSWLGPLGVIAKHESGGNPRAINLWDINAQRGIPSKGLMQTIGPTFNAYKGKGMSDIWNPIHNAVAAINYIKSRYGNVFNVPGIRSMARGGAYRGYAQGGVVDGHHLAHVGEDNKKEVIIPLERYRHRALGLLAYAQEELGVGRRMVPTIGAGTPKDLAPRSSGNSGRASITIEGINVTPTVVVENGDAVDAKAIADEIAGNIVDAIADQIESVGPNVAG